MIRNDYDLSDEDFDNVIKPFDKALREYVNNFVHEYLAFYLATGFKLDALWEGTLSGHISSALDGLCEIPINDSDVSKVREIMKNKYSLILTDNEQIEILDIKK